MGLSSKSAYGMVRGDGWNYEEVIEESYASASFLCRSEAVVKRNRQNRKQFAFHQGCMLIHMNLL